MLGRTNYSLTQLEYVLAVHKYGHFAKAAESCQVTQPTLSMQIQKLEENLGVVIFDRTKKPILLTEVGRKLIDQIQTVLFEARRIESLIDSAQSEELQGKLVLGIIPTIAPYLLPRFLPAFTQEFPLVELKILELQTHRMIEELNEDQIDLGILATPLKVSKILELPLFYEPFSLLCQKGHPLTQQKRVTHEALRREDLWLLEEGHCLRSQVLDVCSIRKRGRDQKRIQFESGSLETLKRLIRSFGGYTLLPGLATDELGPGVELLTFESPIPAREVGMIFRREHHKKELRTALAKIIQKNLPSLVSLKRRPDFEVLSIG